MAYTEWFNSWHDGEVTLRGYFRPPEELTADRISSADESAERLLGEAWRLVEDLTSYRQALAERYAALSTMPYTLRLELTRNRSWTSGLVTYDLRLYRRYEDGTEAAELREHYTGRQRREALARFEALRKERPGIETKKDITPNAWEK